MRSARGLLLALSLAGVAQLSCRSKDAPSVLADRPSPSPSVTPSAVSSSFIVSTPLPERLDCIDGVIGRGAVPLPSEGLGLSGTGAGGGGAGGGVGSLGAPGHGGSAGPEAHVIGSLLDAPPAVAEPLARILCAEIPKLRACYETARKVDPSLAGDLTFELDIGGSNPSAVLLLSSSFADGPLRRCAFAAVDSRHLLDLPSSTSFYTLRLTPVAVRSTRSVHDGTMTGALSSDDVRRILHASAPRFRACYEQALEAQPTLAGSVATRAIVDASGTVVRATSTGGTLHDAAVVECVRGVFLTLFFPHSSSGILDSRISFATE